jgi:hypothetical protein
MQKQIIELGFNKKMETKTSAKWTVKRFLLEEIWLWSLCLDEFVGRGEFRSRRWVAARICPWWVHAICNECGVCERKLSLVSFKQKKIPPLWRVINNRESKEIQNTNLTYCLVEMKFWGRKVYEGKHKFQQIKNLPSK